jgi:CheY-like chemotaxis protein
LTGYGREPDRRRSAQAGFDEHFVKPVVVDRLLELLAQPARRERLGRSAGLTP